MLLVSEFSYGEAYRNVILDMRLNTVFSRLICTETAVLCFTLFIKSYWNHVVESSILTLSKNIVSNI